MAEDDKIAVALTPKQQGLVWETNGAAAVVEALREVKKSGTTAAGFILALAVAEKTLAEMRISMGQMALRAAAAAGHDISRCPAISTGVRDGQAVLLLAPPDLFGGEEP